MIVSGDRAASDPWDWLKSALSLVADAGPAGRLLRIALPAAFAVIVLSGLAVFFGHRMGFVGIAVGAALFAAVNGLTFTVLIFWAAVKLHAEHVGRRRVQGEIQHYALHDPLTGLANRGFFMDQLARRAALADRRTSLPFAVCSLELDGFERVTGRLGREAGNQIMIKCADLMKECVRASDVVARLGDGRFGILLEEIAEPKDVSVLAQRIVSSIPGALENFGAGTPISASIGVILRSSAQDPPTDLLRQADAALETAKKRGPGRFELTAFAD